MRCSSVAVAAPADLAWRTLADFGELARWAPDLVSHSRLLSQGPVDVGAVRRVQVRRQALLEQIVEFEPPRVLAYTISGLPPVVRRAVTRWEIRAEAAGCDIRVGSEVVAPGPVARLVEWRLLAADAKLLRALASALGSTAGVAS